MHYRISIKILGKFTKKEMKGWLAFLNNPEHNKNKDIINLAKYIHSYYPKLETPELEKGITMIRVFNLSSLENINEYEHKFNYLLSDFLKN